MTDSGTNLQARFDAALDRLVGMTCWGVIPRHALSVMFGGKRLEERALASTRLRDDLRRYSGEYMIFIMSPWVMRRNAEILCTSDDIHLHGEVLPRLEGQRVLHVSTDPANVLRVTFEEGVDLTAYHASVPPSYDYFTPEEVFSIGDAGAVTIEPRSQPQRPN